MKKFVSEDLKMKNELLILKESDKNHKINVTNMHVTLSTAQKDVAAAKEVEKKLKDALVNMEKKMKLEIDNVESKFQESQKKEKSLNQMLENINLTNNKNSSQLTNSLLVVQNEVKNSAEKEIVLLKELEESKTSNLSFISKIEILEKCIDDTTKKSIDTYVL